MALPKDQCWVRWTREREKNVYRFDETMNNIDHRHSHIDVFDQDGRKHNLDHPLHKLCIRVHGLIEEQTDHPWHDPSPGLTDRQELDQSDNEEKIVELRRNHQWNLIRWSAQVSSVKWSLLEFESSCREKRKRIFSVSERMTKAKQCRWLADEHSLVNWWGKSLFFCV